MDDPSRDRAALEERMRRLEGRLDRIEALLSARVEAPPADSPDLPIDQIDEPVTRNHDLLSSGEPQPVEPARPGYELARSDQQASPAAIPIAATPPVQKTAAGASQPPQHKPAAARGPSLADRIGDLDLEELLSGRVLAWTGGLAILIGALFFLSLAFREGWIGPGVRVLMGVVTGLGLVAGGALFFNRKERVFGHVLLATGLGVYNLALFAATRLYDLVPAEAALLASLVGAVAGAVIAINANSQIVAAYGLLGALLAPVLLDTGPSTVAAAFLATILVGTTAIALHRAWSWLPLLAFLFTVPQYLAWLESGPNVALGLTGIAAYWLLNTLSAGGEEFRKPTFRLRPTSASLMLLNAFAVIGGGFLLLAGDLAGWRGLFLVIVALAHLLIADYFLIADGARHPFGMLTFGAGLAAIAMAVPVQFGGPTVPLAWSAQAAGLFWVYGRLRNGYALLVGGALFLGALAHLLVFEFPLPSVNSHELTRTAFVNTEFATLVFVIAALAFSSIAAGSRRVTAVLGLAGTIMLTYALPFELSDAALVGSWMLLALLAAGQDRLAQLTSLDYWRGVAGWLCALLLAGVASLHIIFIDLPLADVSFSDPPLIALWSNAVLAGALWITAFLGAAVLALKPTIRQLALLGALAATAYAMAFVAPAPAIVLAWCALALVPYLMARRDAGLALVDYMASGWLLALAVAVTLDVIAPPSRLAVRDTSGIDHPLYLSGATIALGAIALHLGLAYVLQRTRPHAVWFGCAAGIALVYLASIGLVDEFQSWVGTGPALETIQKQAQVGLSILWATLGAVALLAGILRRTTALRLFGLGLLGLAVVKVFIVDLAALDASYRVISFIVLGVLLLASSFVYQRLMPTSRRTDDETAGSAA